MAEVLCIVSSGSRTFIGMYDKEAKVMRRPLGMSTSMKQGPEGINMEVAFFPCFTVKSDVNFESVDYYLLVPETEGIAKNYVQMSASIYSNLIVPGPTMPGSRMRQ